MTRQIWCPRKGVPRTGRRNPANINWACLSHDPSQALAGVRALRITGVGRNRSAPPGTADGLSLPAVRQATRLLERPGRGRMAEAVKRAQAFARPLAFRAYLAIMNITGASVIGYAFARVVRDVDAG